MYVLYIIINIVFINMFCWIVQRFDPLSTKFGHISPIILQRCVNIAMYHHNVWHVRAAKNFTKPFFLADFAALVTFCKIYLRRKFLGILGSIPSFPSATEEKLSILKCYFFKHKCVAILYRFSIDLNVLTFVNSQT